MRMRLPSFAEAVCSGLVVLLERVNGRIELRSADGHVGVRELAGDIRIHTADGSVRAEDVDGQVDIDTADGGVVLEGKLAGAQVHTGDGSISLRAREGSAMTDDWALSTSDGSIVAALPAPFNAELDARTGDGRVRIEDGTLSTKGEVSRGSAKGQMGKGGRMLKLRSSDGSISVRKS